MGGDALDYFWLDDDPFAIYLLDDCSHGEVAHHSGRHRALLPSGLASRQVASYFRAMKPVVLILLTLLVVPPARGWGADQNEAARAAAIAEKQEQEDRTRRLEASVRDLLAAQEDQQRRLTEQAHEIDLLRDELRRLRDDLLKAGADAVTRDDLKKLVETISEVDKKRVEDNKLLKEVIESLGAKLLAVAAAPPATPERREEASSDGTPEVGYWHVVESGQYLSMIVKAYREQGVKVNLQQVMDANPGVNWNRLPIGKKIFIPDPSKAKTEGRP